MDAVLRILADYSPADCRHTLDVYAAEGECLRADQGDALAFLNGTTNWSRKNFEHMAAMTVDGVRKQHFRRQRGRARTNESTRNIKEIK